MFDLEGTIAAEEYTRTVLKIAPYTLPTIPYIYHLIFKLTGQHYIGVRYANGCHPDELLAIGYHKAGSKVRNLTQGGYRTTSKRVRELIEKHGLDAFEIVFIKRLTYIWEAVKYEEEVLSSIDAATDDMFLNDHNGGKNFAGGSPENISKGVKRYYANGGVHPWIGRNHSEETCKIISELKTQYFANGGVHPNTGKTLPRSQIEKQQESLKRYYANGGVHPNQGKKLPKDQVKKQQESLKLYYANGGINPNKGKPIPENVLKAMLDGQKRAIEANGGIHPLKGKKHSEEHCKANSEAKLKYYANGGVHPYKGKKMTDVKPDWVNPNLIPMPEDFPSVAHLRNPDLCIRYNVSVAKITEWRKECNFVLPLRTMPEDFPQNAHLTLRELCRLYKTAHKTIRRWKAELHAKDAEAA
jgi:hypothetical protein